MPNPILNRIILFPLKPIKPHFLYSFSSSALPPPSDQPPLVCSVVSLLTHHRSKSRWSYLRSLLSSSPDDLTPAHFSQIALQLKSNPHLALRFFFFTLHNSLCSHNLQSYSTIIHILARARLKSHAQSIIRIALRSPVLLNHSNSSLKLFEMLTKTYRECNSAPFVFDLLIKSCLELKKIDGSIEIVRMLSSRGISPQISTCHDLVSWVSKCKGSLAGYGIFREVFGLRADETEGMGKRVRRVRPNVHSFNNLMVHFFKDGDLEMVLETWAEMERFGCVPNGYSYSILMAVYCEEGKIKEAEKSWDEMRVKGIKPDVVAYNTIIDGFCKTGEIEKAEEFVREMELSGVDGTCVTSEHLINGYCGIGDIDSAILVYRDMCRKNFSPEVSTMDALIGGLCEKKRVSEAMEIMKIAVRNASFHPSKNTYEFLIKALCEDGNMEEALKLQAKMVGKGHVPDPKIYDTFIEGYMKLGDEQMVTRLRKEMYETQK
ncbi:pentatricopeptide repeat-containing protein At2g15980 [Euphorbia lathyris]|uniref:pentatricopeptide repeat-containing protein At2g15980 n=1 Tax=Euphorbia lathyris TaxID=212925 RepID=UPI003313161C